eukprot:NODE_3779_length_883_cov_3.340528_g3141_i0.p2 GENE.NODE_3779_length_883_cov_3.340528_g3141_i0~~NODE_3779_length_883_cov_3.340528_g3141_i0.p2  ORF type:complete len:152 (-),score=11.21 NODE_3779_length_883_cov_3.340528_g3141_i0:107-562(-)
MADDNNSTAPLPVSPEFNPLFLAPEDSSGSEDASIALGIALPIGLGMICVLCLCFIILLIWCCLRRKPLPHAVEKRTTRTKYMPDPPPAEFVPPPPRIIEHAHAPPMEHAEFVPQAWPGPVEGGGLTMAEWGGYNYVEPQALPPNPYGYRY